MSVKISLIVNNKNYKLDVEPYETLNFILREKLELTGTKQGCDTGGCGSCTVILDGKAVYSCMTFGVKVNGSTILTIEGLKKNDILDPVQQSFVDNAALQCGYCTPGFVMCVKALLDEKIYGKIPYDYPKKELSRLLNEAVNERNLFFHHRVENTEIKDLKTLWQELKYIFEKLHK